MRDYKKMLYIKINGALDKRLKSFRRRRLCNTDFSIVSNNCWAGYVYRRYGLPYLTPTVGLYFFADEYIKLCSDFKEYMQKPLEFISYTESKYKDRLEEKKQTNVPIARLGDIEVVFLHYATRQEAEEKWKRRVERINYDNLIFKFSKMSGATGEHLKQFDRFDFSKKICFVPSGDDSDIKCGVHFRSVSGNGEINNDTGEYARYINITKMINAETVCGKHMEGKRVEI